MAVTASLVSLLLAACSPDSRTSSTAGPAPASTLVESARAPEMPSSRLIATTATGLTAPSANAPLLPAATASPDKTPAPAPTESAPYTHTTVSTGPGLKLPPPLPVVLAPGGMPTGLDDRAGRRIADLAEHFLAATTAPDPTSPTPPTDPAQPTVESPSPDRMWDLARRASDEQYRALYGDQAYQSRQLANRRQDYQQTTGAAVAP